MIYGYIRVSSDKQTVENQRFEINNFCERNKLVIDGWIEETISGTKSYNKRELGKLLKRVQKDDLIICAELSRLGRNLFMIMEILNICMTKECRVWTIKDNYRLGEDIQSKVLAFAFGLSAEIERQMIRQRTKEGLRLRMKLGVLVGRPIGRLSENVKLDAVKDKVIEQYNWGVPLRRLAENFNVDRNTISRTLARWGITEKKDWQKKQRNETYKDEPYKVVNLDMQKCIQLISEDKTIPEIAERFPEYSYEQVYDTILCNQELNNLYRKHGQLKLKRK